MDQSAVPDADESSIGQVSRWRPEPRAQLWGLVSSGASALALLVSVAVTFWQAQTLWVSVTVLGIGIFSASTTWTALWLLALRRLGYVLTSEHLVIISLLGEHRIPLGRIEGIYSGERAGPLGDFEGLKWPGCFIGSARSTPLQEPPAGESFQGTPRVQLRAGSLDSGELTLVVCGGKVFGLSPEDHRGFRAALIAAAQVRPMDGARPSHEPSALGKWSRVVTDPWAGVYILAAYVAVAAGVVLSFCSPTACPGPAPSGSGPAMGDYMAFQAIATWIATGDYIAGLALTRRAVGVGRLLWACGLATIVVMLIAVVAGG